MVRGQEAVGKKREPRKFFWISHLSRRGVGRDARGAPLVLERPRQRERRIRCNVIVSDRCARPTSSQLARVSASVADQQNISTLRASHRRSTLAPIAVFDRRRLGPQSEPARAREVTAPVRSRSHQHKHESARVGRAETSANRSRSARGRASEPSEKASVGGQDRKMSGSQARRAASRLYAAGSRASSSVIVRALGLIPRDRCSPAARSRPPGLIARRPSAPPPTRRRRPTIAPWLETSGSRRTSTVGRPP